MSLHLFGFMVHLVYTVMLNYYVYEIYSRHVDGERKNFYVFILAASMIYTWIYDVIQLCKTGPLDYLSDPWNYVDFFYIYGSLGNCVV